MGREIQAGEVILPRGKLHMVDGWPMIYIEGGGAVQFDLFRIRKQGESILPGKTVIYQDGGGSHRQSCESKPEPTLGTDLAHKEYRQSLKRGFYTHGYQARLVHELRMIGDAQDDQPCKS